MAFLRRWVGADDTAEDVRDRMDLNVAKHALNEERGYYRQAVLRFEVNSKNLMKTWETANGMIHGAENDKTQG